MDIIETPQDKSAVSSETAGYTLADNRALPLLARGQSYFPPSQLLVYLQTAEKGDERVRDNKGHLVSLRKAYPILFHTENKQLAKISSLTANDLETSEVPYFTSFCIKSKERL